MLATLLFKKDKKIVNPMSPEETTTLVTIGIFSISRNPKYPCLFLSISSTILVFYGGNLENYTHWTQMVVGFTIGIVPIKIG